MFKRKSLTIDSTIATELDGNFNEHEMASLTSLGTIIELPADEVFVTEGAVGREAVIIVTGSALVMRDGETVAEIGSGAIVGESALLNNEPRNASLMTTTPSKVAVLTRREFASFLDQCPRVATQVNELARTRTA